MDQEEEFYGPPKFSGCWRISRIRGGKRMANKARQTLEDVLDARTHNRRPKLPPPVAQAGRAGTGVGQELGVRRRRDRSPVNHQAQYRDPKNAYRSCGRWGTCSKQWIKRKNPEWKSSDAKCFQQIID
jgi:hypothetical protein